MQHLELPLAQLQLDTKNPRLGVVVSPDEALLGLIELSANQSASGSTPNWYPRGGSSNEGLLGLRLRAGGSRQSIGESRI